MSRNNIDPQLDLINRIGEQMDEMQRSRAIWFVLAVAGWLVAVCLYFG